MIVVIALLLAVQGIAMSQEKGPEGRGRRFAGPGRRGPQGAMMLRRIVHRLDLTEEQIQKVKTIAKNNKETVEATEKTLEQARNAVHEAVVKGAAESEVRAAAASLGATLADQAVNKAATMASIRAILTEEQLKELDELGVERKGRGIRGRRGMGRRGRGGPGAMRGGRGRGGPGGMRGHGPRSGWRGGRGYGRGDFDGCPLEHGRRGYGRGEFGGRRWEKGGREFGEHRGRGYRGRDRSPWWDEDAEEEHQGADND